MDAKLRKLMLAMIEYNCGDARRIQHLLKVHTTYAGKTYRRRRKTG